MGELNLQGAQWILGGLRDLLFPQKRRLENQAVIQSLQNEGEKQRQYNEWLKTGAYKKELGHGAAQTGLIEAQTQGVIGTNADRTMARPYIPQQLQAGIEATRAGTEHTRAQTADIPLARAQSGRSQDIQEKSVVNQRDIDEARLRLSDAQDAARIAQAMEQFNRELGFKEKQLAASQIEDRQRNVGNLMTYEVDPARRQQYLDWVAPGRFTPATVEPDTRKEEALKRITAIVDEGKGKVAGQPADLRGQTPNPVPQQGREPWPNAKYASPPPLDESAVLDPKNERFGFGETAFGRPGIMGLLKTPPVPSWSAFSKQPTPSKPATGGQEGSPEAVTRMLQNTAPQAQPPKPVSGPSLQPAAKPTLRDLITEQIRRGKGETQFKGAENYAPELPAIPEQVIRQYISQEVLQNPQMVQQLIATLLQQG